VGGVAQPDGVEAGLEDRGGVDLDLVSPTTGAATLNLMVGEPGSGQQSPPSKPSALEQPRQSNGPQEAPSVRPPSWSGSGAGSSDGRQIAALVWPPQGAAEQSTPIVHSSSSPMKQGEACTPAST
jgi:hypothetical protein